MKKILLVMMLPLLLIGCQSGTLEGQNAALELDNQKLQSKLDALHSDLNRFDDYVGYWHRTREGGADKNGVDTIMLIWKDDYAYVLAEDALKPVFGAVEWKWLQTGVDSPILQKGDEIQSLVLVDDGSQLIFAGLTYDRINRSAYLKIRENEIQKEKARLVSTRRECVDAHLEQIEKKVEDVSPQKLLQILLGCR